MLLADAAHACTPNLSQGAGQAIKDADTLASCIATDNDTISALEKDRAVPMKPARTLVNMAWKLTVAAYARNPLLVALRNRIMSSIPERIVDKKIDFIFDVRF